MIRSYPVRDVVSYLKDVYRAVAENSPVLSSAPAPIADEVKAAVAAVQAANESVKETLGSDQPSA